MVDENILIMFVTHCATSLGLSYSTIKQYLNGIRYHCVKLAGFNPLLTDAGVTLNKLQLVMRGIRKTEVKFNRQVRMPVTSFVLGRLINLLNGGVFGPYMDSLMKAACSLAFFAFLRCGEFTTQAQSFDAQNDLCYSDITVVTHEAGQLEKMYLKIKVSKADPFRQGCTIVLFTTATDTCPVQNMVHFLTKRSISLISPSEPLFLTADRKPLTRTVFVDSLRVLLLRLGFNPQHYAGHSFRIGAATSAAAAGIPDHLVKTLGRWSSDCYQRYIRTSESVLRNSQCHLAHSVQSQ